MKRIFAILMTITVLLNFNIFYTSAQGGTRFIATSPRAAAGAVITVKISVETVEALAAYKVTLGYDGDVLSPLPTENANYFYPDNGMDSWINMSDVKLNTSSISFLAFSMQSSFTGKTNLICMDFEVLKAYDTAPVTLRVDDVSNVNCQTISDVSAEVVLEPEICGIRIEKPSRLVYEAGESLSFDGFSLTAVYSDNTERAIPMSDLRVSGFSSEPGEHKVTVCYCGFSEQFIVRVKPIGTGVLGDANCDGKVTLADVTAAAMHVAGIKTLGEPAKYNADVNISGGVTLADVTLIAKHVAGIALIG